MESNSRYKSLDYWNERYKEEDHYEWFGDYSKFKDVIHSIVRPSDKILTLGCGNSRMSEELYLDNFTNIVNTDYSPVLIEAMKNKYHSLEKMSWLVMDINNLEFEDNSFDCVIEKGTLDALLVDEKDPWNMSQENKFKMQIILEQVSRILKNGGVFISITFAQPHFRKPLYAHDKFNWSIQLFPIGDTFHYFIYVMKKGEELSAGDRELNSFKKLSDSKIKPVELEENNLFLIQID
ncbi:endothelin-converting enzyme 2 [Brachionus plicatilis]|uniref:EEF1A lysine methyltransferase 4 n=1 Tax=Brachionus plicatilis TaxID=10195 RepID=A0A3M7Q190_BRAPC|nr:endothelin-converting enzyme 2 [Brachionus plicatilis]